MPHLTLLRFQYRMHPEISDIPNRLIYEGRLVDKGTPLPALPHEELGTRSLVLYDTSAVNPWSSRPLKGSRCNLYSAVVAATLAERAIGRVTRTLTNYSGDKIRHLIKSIACVILNGHTFFCRKTDRT